MTDVQKKFFDGQGCLAQAESLALEMYNSGYLEGIEKVEKEYKADAEKWREQCEVMNKSYCGFQGGE